VPLGFDDPVGTVHCDGSTPPKIKTATQRIRTKRTDRMHY